MAVANTGSARTRPSIDDVRAVRGDVDRFADRTPMRRAHDLGDRTGSPVFLKLESLQPTGSFKIRGAAAKLGSLTADQRERGVITASTGNHGRAVAYVGRALGIDATVCLSEKVPGGKVALLEQLGCTLDVGGSSQDLAFERAIAASERPGGPILVHSILDPVVVAGQGTCGLEIAEQCPEAALVIVPVSGGGLIAGVAVAIRSILPEARVVGVSMEGGAVMHASLAAGHPVQLDEVETLADSLQGGLGPDNDTTFPIVQRLVDDVVLVSEADIEAAMRSTLRDHRIVLEGAGAVGIAALASGRIQPAPDDVTVVVCSGANAELATIAEMAR